MPKPRHRPPGAVYKITRRTFDRTFFFVPTTAIVFLWKYLFAVAAERHGIKLHVIFAASNHYHAIVTDTYGLLGEFLAYLHSELARAVNSKLRRTGIVWDPGRPSVQRIFRPEDILSDALYVVSNPVKHKLTHTAAAWPGFVTLPAQIGTTQTIRRPSFFFNSDDDAIMPKTAKLELVEPDIFAKQGPGAFASRLSDLLTAEERAIQKQVARAGGSFVGRKTIKETNPLDSPSTPADKRKRGFDPELVCRDPTMLGQEIANLKTFRKRYDRARRLWLRYRNKGRAIFPHGTYAMRRFHGALVEGPPDRPPPDATHSSNA